MEIRNISINALLSHSKFSGFTGLNKYRIEIGLPKGFPGGSFVNVKQDIVSNINTVITNPTVSNLGRLTNNAITTQFESQAASNSNSSSGGIPLIENKINQNGIISLYCSSCSMPARSLLTYDHKQLVAPYRVPYSLQQYDPVIMSFLTNEDFETRTYFETWMGAVVNCGSNSLNYYDEYVADIRIIPLTGAGYDSVYYVDLLEAYPMTINQLDFSYANADTALITVMFSFKQWASSTDDTAIIKTKF